MIPIGSRWKSCDPRDDLRSMYEVQQCDGDDLLMTKVELDKQGRMSVLLSASKFLARTDTKRGWTMVREGGPVMADVHELRPDETVDELAERLGLDMDEWYVAGVSANTNANGHVSVSARFKRREGGGLGVIADLKADMVAHSPYQGHVALDTVRGSYLLEIDCFDHHFGMLAWGAENDGRPYDLSIATDLFRNAFARALALAEVFPVERILIPLGNDLLHFDGGWGEASSGGMTMSGTLLDVDTRFRKVYRQVRTLLVAAIEAATDIAPVDVVVVSGNHSGQSEFTLGDSLECWFNANPDVHIDNGPAARKYYRFHKTLIGFTHGDKEKLADLPMIMAQERPQDWADTTIREWHTGHRHRRKRTTWQPIEDVHGVLVRELPSLIPPDAWHYLRGYVTSRKGFTCLLHSRDGTDSGEFTIGSEGLKNE